MLTKIKRFLDRNKLWPVADVLVFVIITLGFHKLWWAFLLTGINNSGLLVIIDWLAEAVYVSSAWVDAHIFGLDLTLKPVNILQFNINQRAIQINESCSGFKQMWQVLVLFLVFPGPWKHKLWFIPMGMASMFLVNVIRIVGLSFAMIYWPEHWDFIHMWILRPFYYVVIFILWVIWVEKYGGVKRYFAKS